MFVNSVIDLPITRVKAALRLVNSPVGVTVRRTCREGWAIALKISGKTVYRCGEKEIRSDGLHPVLLPGGSSYSWECSEPGTCLIIEFDALAKSDRVFQFSVSDSAFFTNAFSRIEKSLSRNENDCQIECAYLLYGILLTLFKSAKKEYVPRDKAELLQPALDYMSEGFSDSSVTNDTLARLCGVSTVYFRKIFESVYGISPIRYLHNLRMDQAKRMLLSDYDSIHQIAESVGYNSIYHFSKMFKAYTGISPSEYAKSSRT